MKNTSIHFHLKTILYAICIFCISMPFACCQRAHPYEETVEVRLPDSLHTSKIWFARHNSSVFMNVYLYKKGFRDCCTHLRGRIQYDSDFAPHTFFLEQEFVSDNLNKKERKFYQEPLPVQVDVVLDKEKQGYFITISHAQCKALQTDNTLFAKSKAQFRKGLSLKQIIIGLIIGGLLSLYFAIKEKKNPHTTTKEPTKVPKKEKLLFSTKETAALLTLAFYYSSRSKSDDINSIEYKDIREELEHLGLPEDSERYQETMRYFKNMDTDTAFGELRYVTYNKARYVAGLCTHIILSRDTDPNWKNGALNKLLREFHLSDIAPIKLINFWKDHIIRVA